ncbi:tRNA (adenosine(37)-N6)-threonylcarbamoyltransferase complex dimerization subunit type 1 TsaB [Pseudidiomarina sp. 1APP75-27a]|uniref:tRNA (adenosine(37)-N6)-threonylcarbamoyltransferase complex dimerization subunit type 1 TsaB n=1 Tax=Pseudidiomarina terrestris TaxID=2820060 RepID=UPI002B05AFB9|nr:tRNA (adenosine(37)-N6)-threonylcarbamoyltransferase complex dimerization subunit type 1 TsaB [Pseudidiomarina sp. 1APP75-27a]MEA3587332.1 tRNA (adenosine(37)-N6)-threonylcarbamoyltransferase complex dimerization subunit type 1 TsaB [Pseudidiomarina sp. 1APP75-27a]
MSAVLLAIDTATEQCSVALSYGDQCFQRAAVTPREHSQRVLGFVEEVLGEAGITLAEVDGIVCGYGPGSFTGVRIGVAISQGLAFSHNLPVYRVSTLAALAQQAIRCHDAKAVISAIDARMQEVYVASYVNDNGLAQPVSAAQMAPLAPLKAQSWWADISARAAVVSGVGTGWQAYGSQLDPDTQVQVLDAVTLPLAQDMLTLAKQSEPVAAEELEPLYVRNEVTWKKLPGR